MPEASDAFLGVWQTPSITVRTRPSSGTRILEIFARNADAARVSAAVAALGLTTPEITWPR